MPTYPGWWIKICVANTGSNRVVLECGQRDGDNDDTSTFAEWRRDETSNYFKAPDRYQHLQEMYWELNNGERDRVVACVLFDDEVKYSFDFKGAHDTEHVERSDEDDCPC